MISHVVKRHGAMAQSVEHIVHIDGVVGSSPTGTTTASLNGLVFCCLHIVHIDGASNRAPPVADEARGDVT